MTGPADPGRRVALRYLPLAVDLPDYDVVIATHERVSALRQSLPWIADQVPRPQRLIVVDSSSDPDAVRETVESTLQGSAIPLEFVVARAGLTHQRNVGLERVRSPVVFFPDDDTILFPGAARAILEVYARDEGEVVGGVSGRDAKDPPAGFEARDYGVDRVARIRRLVGPTRYALEGRLMPDSFLVHVLDRWRSPDGPAPPSWLGGGGTMREGWMKGFRMTFRTSAIRASGFDEHLWRYGLFEDVDASFAVMARYVLVQALDAPMYHHSAPGARGDARAMGVMQILNRGYLTYKHGTSGSPTQRAMKRFALYKILLYALATWSSHGRRRMVGAVAAFRALPALERAGAADLGPVYERTLARLLRDERGGDPA